MNKEELLNSTGKILVFAHDDLDGAASAALFRAAVDLYGRDVHRNGTTGRRWARYRERCLDGRRVVPRMVNYGRMEAKAREYLCKWHDRFCCAVFLDFSPTEETCSLMDRLGMKYMVIDHHRTAYVQDGNPNATYYMDYSVCGAMGVYNLFSDRLGMQHRCLAYLADDYDMWRHKNYVSRHLCVAYTCRYGFNGFIRYHSRGFNGIGMSVMRAVVRPYYDGLADYIKKMSPMPLPDKGAYVELEPECPYITNISIMMERKFDWYVLARHRGYTVALSFRTVRDDIDFGAVLKSMGMGGGGHAKSAGQHLPYTDDYMAFISSVHDKAFGNGSGD